MRKQNYSSEQDDWAKIEKNNVTIALNVFYVKNKKIYHAKASKHNSNEEKQVILLMVSNGETRKARSEGQKAKSEGRVAKYERWQ